MATLATVYNRFFMRDLEGSRPASRRADAASRLRPFANEDIFLFVKRIDNTRVVREADPKARGVCWRLIGSGVEAAVLLIRTLFPSASPLLPGSQLHPLPHE